MDNNLKLLGYRIDNKIHYSVENKRIYPLYGSDKSTPLRLTKARLLEHLLLNSGDEVITDQELLENVWDKYGLKSSNQRLWRVMRELKSILSGFNVSNGFLTRVEYTGYLVNDDLIGEVIEHSRKKKQEELEAVTE